MVNMYLAAVIDWHSKAILSHKLSHTMDGKGRATDNIAIERFWRTAKYEHVYLSDHKSIKELRSGIDNYITFYNRRRFHQSLRYEKPMEVYRNSISHQELMAA